MATYLTIVPLAVLLLAGCGPAKLSEPTAALYAVSQHAEAGNWAAVYDALDAQSRKTVEGATAVTLEISENADRQNPEWNRVRALEPRDRFAEFGYKHVAAQKTSDLIGATMIREIWSGTRADVTVKTKAGEEKTFRMVLEDGSWRLSLRESSVTSP